jgi:hypothetical protein
VETTENQNRLKLREKDVQEDRIKGYRTITRFAACMFKIIDNFTSKCEKNILNVFMKVSAK